MLKFRSVGLLLVFVLSLLTQPSTCNRNDPSFQEFTKVYTVNETLDPLVYEPVQHVQARLQMLEYLEVIIKHFEKNSIDWFLAFGNTLSSHRNGIAMMPWDNGIDIAIPMSMRYRMGNGLKEATDVNHAWCSAENREEKSCKIWELTDDGIYLLWKSWGVPWKIFNTRKLFRGYHLTFVDIYEYVHSTKSVYIPNKVLRYGFIKKWSVPIEYIYPLETMTLPFTGEGDQDKTLTKQITVSVPFDSRAVIEYTYGLDAMEICKTFSNKNHKEFEMMNSAFPCKMLPKHYFNGTKDETTQPVEERHQTSSDST